jgi:CrcB protein
LNWLLVAAGGAAGSLTRYFVGTIMQGFSRDVGFPFGTFTVNLLGCFLIGLYFGFHERGLPDQTRLLLVVGFLGGFTTFSSFGYETFELITGGNIGVAFLNVFVQCGAGLLLVWAGVQAARAIP